MYKLGGKEVKPITLMFIWLWVLNVIFSIFNFNSNYFQTLGCGEASLYEKQSKPVRILADVDKEECLKYLSNTTILNNMVNQDIIILLDTGDSARKWIPFILFILEASKFRSSSPWVSSFEGNVRNDYYNLHHLTRAQFNVFRVNFEDSKLINNQDRYKVCWQGEIEF